MLGELGERGGVRGGVSDFVERRAAVVGVLLGELGGVLRKLAIHEDCVSALDPTRVERGLGRGREEGVLARLEARDICVLEVDNDRLGRGGAFEDVGDRIHRAARRVADRGQHLERDNAKGDARERRSERHDISRPRLERGEAQVLRRDSRSVLHAERACLGFRRGGRVREIPMKRRSFIARDRATVSP